MRTKDEVIVERLKNSSEYRYLRFSLLGCYSFLSGMLILTLISLLFKLLLNTQGWNNFFYVCLVAFIASLSLIFFVVYYNIRLSGMTNKSKDYKKQTIRIETTKTSMHRTLCTFDYIVDGQNKTGKALAFRIAMPEFSSVIVENGQIEIAINDKGRIVILGAPKEDDEYEI